MALGIVLLVGGHARADRRPVAVVALDANPSAEVVNRTHELVELLISHESLQIIVDSGKWSALQDSITDEDQTDIEAAKGHLGFAETALAKFDFPKAADEAGQGIAALNNVFPNAALDLRADLELAYGIALLGQHKAADADTAFALVRTLAPNRELDAARYLPEIVEAFARAKPQTTHRDVVVEGSGRVWIDGHEVGAAPGTYRLAYGAHVIQLAGPERMTRGRVFDVTGAAADKPLVAQIAEAEAKPSVKVHRARLALARATDGMNRAGAMKALAELVGVNDVILLSTGDDGAVQVEVWQAERSFVTEVDKHESAARLLERIAPPKPRLVEGPIVAVPLPLDPIPVWHKQTRWRLGTAGAIVLMVVATYAIVTYEGSESLNSMPTGGRGWSDPGRMK